MPDRPAPWVFHVDLDQFLAAVEMLRRPELVGRPVVVGGHGDPTARGVVSTASYEARAFGVRSGMPLRVAARRCPEAVFLPVDKPAYDSASAQVMATLQALAWVGDPVDVQVLGWDEAFVGVRDGGTPGPPREPETFAEQIRAEVLTATGLHCSVGIGDTTVQAKNATDFGKPRGVFRISDATWLAQMGHRGTRELWGVGAQTERKLAALGILTVADLAQADEQLLVGQLGPTMGPWYQRLGQGRGSRVVDPTPWVPRAHGREETFQQDLVDRGEQEQAVRRIARRALADVRAEGRPAVRVGLKVRSNAFRTTTRSLSLPEPTVQDAVVEDAAVLLLQRAAPDRPVRLIGVRLEMAPPPGGY